MKNLKALSVLMIFAVTLLGVTLSKQANADRFSTKVIHIGFNQAIQSPELVDAMHEQLDDAFLMQNNQAYYTESILYQNLTIIITGTYEQWRSFFSSGTGISIQNTKEINFR